MHSTLEEKINAIQKIEAPFLVSLKSEEDWIKKHTEKWSMENPEEQARISDNTKDWIEKNINEDWGSGWKYLCEANIDDVQKEVGSIIDSTREHLHGQKFSLFLQEKLGNLNAAYKKASQRYDGFLRDTDDMSARIMLERAMNEYVKSRNTLKKLSHDNAQAFYNAFVKQLQNKEEEEEKTRDAKIIQKKEEEIKNILREGMIMQDNYAEKLALMGKGAIHDAAMCAKVMAYFEKKGDFSGYGTGYKEADWHDADAYNASLTSHKNISDALKSYAGRDIDDIIAKEPHDVVEKLIAKISRERDKIAANKKTAFPQDKSIYQTIYDVRTDVEFPNTKKNPKGGGRLPIAGPVKTSVETGQEKIRDIKKHYANLLYAGATLDIGSIKIPADPAIQKALADLHDLYCMCLAVDRGADRTIIDPFGTTKPGSVGDASHGGHAWSRNNLVHQIIVDAILSNDLHTMQYILNEFKHLGKSEKNFVAEEAPKAGFKSTNLHGILNEVGIDISQYDKAQEEFPITENQQPGKVLLMASLDGHTNDPTAKILRKEIESGTIHTPTITLERKKDGKNGMGVVHGIGQAIVNPENKQKFKKNFQSLPLNKFQAYQQAKLRNAIANANTEERGKINIAGIDSSKKSGLSRDENMSQEIYKYSRIGDVTASVGLSHVNPIKERLEKMGVPVSIRLVRGDETKHHKQQANSPVKSRGM